MKDPRMDLIHRGQRRRPKVKPESSPSSELAGRYPEATYDASGNAPYSWYLELTLSCEGRRWDAKYDGILARDQNDALSQVKKILKDDGTTVLRVNKAERRPKPNHGEGDDVQ